jgi:UDP:flavonoid glycosyltransferase YjiC (YdhE family)
VAKIICITTGLTGILHASFEVVSRLEKAGHQVTYACPWDIEEKVVKQGFNYLQLPPVNFNPAPALPDFQGPLVRLKKIGTSLLKIKERRMKAIEALGMDKFSAVLDELEPDFMLIDLELHDFILTAVSKEIPTVLLNQFFSIWESPNLPPIHQPTIPGQGWRGHRLGIKLAWLIVRARQKLFAWKRRLLTAFTDRRSILLYYAKQIGFPSNELIEEYEFPPPLTYRMLPVISLTAWELEFPHTPRPNLYYVGPMVFLNRQDPNADSRINNQLEQIFEAKNERGFKLIYCSFSTLQKADEKFVQRIIEAVSNRTEWKLIIGLGGLLKNASFKNVPKNVYTYEWVPQLQVLRYADCSINHGGIHTINECIHFGVPMLIYSGKKFDQDGNAARIAFHGLGIMADKDIDDAQNIQNRIETILTDSSFKTRVDEINSQLKKQNDKLVRLVEDFLAVEL